MIKIDEDNNLHITRGDCSSDGMNTIEISFDGYTFKPEDKITFVAMLKKGFTKEEVLRKEFKLSEIGVQENVSQFDLTFTKEETKKFELKDKKTTFWYTVVLNDSITILGYDEDGAKKIYVYPGAEEEI